VDIQGLHASASRSKRAILASTGAEPDTTDDTHTNTHTRTRTYTHTHAHSPTGQNRGIGRAQHIHRGFE